MLTVDEYRQMVDDYFKLHYRTPLSALEIAETPGYWRDKEPCGGKRKCRALVHHYCIGWDNGIKHTYYYAENNARDSNGRFVSPHRAWKALKAGD